MSQFRKWKSWRLVGLMIEFRRAEDGTRIPLDVRAGDQILFAKYGGTEFTLDEEELLILSEKDILAVVAS